MSAPRSTLFGQRVVIASLATNAFVISGLGAAVTGMFIAPIMTYFGWTNRATSTLIPAYAAANLLVTPAVGVAIDRLGARVVMGTGILVASLGYLLASRSNGWSLLLIAFALIGVGNAGSFYLPSTVLIADRLNAERNFAMGIIMGAASVGAAILSPLVGWLIERQGWRNTLELMSAAVALMLVLLLASASRQPPMSPSRASDGEHQQPREMPLLRSPTFLIAAGSSALFTFGISGIQFHVVPVLLQAGFSSHAAGLVFGSTWLLSSLGSLAFGASADRLGPGKILAVALLCVAFGTLCLLAVSKSPLGIASMVAFALLWGTPANAAFQLVPVILTERFGSKSLGTLVGAQSALAGLMGAGAPVITGAIYDDTRSYGLAICLSAAVTTLAFLLAFTIAIGRPQRRIRINACE